MQWWRKQRTVLEIRDVAKDDFIDLLHLLLKFKKEFNDIYPTVSIRKVGLEIEDHYKNTRGQKHWTDNLCGRRDAQRKFYSKHIRKWVNKRRGLGSLKDWTIYYKKFRLSGK